MRDHALQPGTILPEYRVSAPRPVDAAENQVHDDRVARSLGFKAGLVPGFVVYAWMTHPVVRACGPAWLASGTFSVRFAQPIYYEEEATVRARVAASTDDLVTIEVHATNAAGEPCAVATMGLPGGPKEPAVRGAPDLAAYPAAPLPPVRPPASRTHLSSLGLLGTPEILVDETAAAAFLSLAGESLPLYRGAVAAVHPALYLDQANCALDRNVFVTPWLHVESHGRHLSIARVGERLSTRGRISRLFDRKGHEFVELDLLLVAGGSRPVASVRHVAVYKLRQAS